MFTDDVYFETELRVKGKTLSQDIALISGRRHYSGGRTISFSNCFCRIELCMERIFMKLSRPLYWVSVSKMDHGLSITVVKWLASHHRGHIRSLMVKSFILLMPHPWKL